MVNKKLFVSQLPIGLLTDLLNEPDLATALYKLATEIEKQSGGAIKALILLFDPTSGCLKPTAFSAVMAHQQKNSELIPIEIDGSPTARCAFHKKMVFVNDTLQDKGFQTYASCLNSYGIQSTLAFPILTSKEELLGTFSFYFTETLQAPPPETEGLQTLVQIASLVIEKNKQEVQTQSLVQELQSSQERLNLALAAQKIGVWDWHIQENKLIWDEAMFEIFGLTRDEFDGTIQGFERTCHPEDIPNIWTAIRRTFEDHVDFDCEFRVLKDNEERYVKAMGLVVRSDNGTVTRMTGLNWDITDKVAVSKRAEAENARAVINSKMASLGEMASGVAHEINNPLTIIMNRAHQLKAKIERGGLDPLWAIGELEKIEMTVERIAKIIRGLRAFSRNADQDPLITCEINSVVDETLELCRERFKKFGVRLTLVGFAEIASVECRPAQISQVLLNLLNNSFDAIYKSQQPWIEISLEHKEDQLMISVTDSGSGIPKEIASKMMNPFFTTKEVGRGTGLGLSISKGIIEDHQGQIFYDQISANTRFVVALPRAIDRRPRAGSAMTIDLL